MTSFQLVVSESETKEGVRPKNEDGIHPIVPVVVVDELDLQEGELWLGMEAANDIHSVTATRMQIEQIVSALIVGQIDKHVWN